MKSLDDYLTLADDDPDAPWNTDPKYRANDPAAMKPSWIEAKRRELENVDALPTHASPPIAAPQKPIIQSGAEFLSGFVPPDYLVDGILQRGFLYSLTGKTGGGKTAIATLIAAHVALGLPLGKREVIKGRVLYLAGENPDDIRMRWIALAEAMDFDPAAVPVDFVPGVFKLSTMTPTLTREITNRAGVALVITDTSAAFFEGQDENSNTQHGAHARLLRELTALPGRPAVIVNCHPTKNAGDDNLLPRGGGAFLAEMDGNLTASKVNGAVELHWQGKFRGPEFAPINFQLETVTCERLRDSRGRTIPTVRARMLTDEAMEELAKVARSNENRVLEAYALTPDASYAAIARSVGWAMRSGEPDKMKVKRAVDTLVQAKLMAKERGKPVVTDKGQKAVASPVTDKAEVEAD